MNEYPPELAVIVAVVFTNDCVLISIPSRELFWMVTLVALPLAQIDHG
jgi:hypothetical protein